MPLPRSMVGRSTKPIATALDAEWLTDFAAAVGDRAAGTPESRRNEPMVAHPLFPVCVEWPAVVAAARLDHGELRADERRRGVHTTHDLTIHRLLRADDVVTTTATIETLEARARGTYERLRLDTRDASGALVSTTRMGSLFLGVGIVGAPPRRAEPIDDHTVEANGCDAPPLDAATVPIEVGADQGRAYSEASRIWNPIHTDAAAARAAGLPAPILHGTCTLASAVSATLAWAGVPAAVAPRRITARFSGMVVMPAVITVRIGRAGTTELCFGVVGPAGDTVVRDGRITLRGATSFDERAGS